MILRRVIALAAALAAVAAAAVVCVLATAFALYALARTWLTPSGAAAVTAAAFAVLGVTIAALALRRAPPQPAETETGLVDRLMRMAKEQPILAAMAAAVAVVVVVRNPAALSALIGVITGALAPNRES